MDQPLNLPRERNGAIQRAIDADRFGPCDIPHPSSAWPGTPERAGVGTMKTLTKLVLCYSGTWFAMADDSPKGRADIRRQFDLYVKHRGAMGYSIGRWVYPILPDGTHGTPTKSHAWDVELSR